MVACLEQGHRGGQDRGHARGGGHAGFGTLERREPVLEHRYRWVGEARVNKARLAPREARGGLCRAVEHEARREEQRLGMLLETGAPLPGAHAQGGLLELFSH